jgi:hypothetical protein
MTPKEKAKKLVVKFIKHSRAEKDIKPIQSAKQCALIAVDEILDNCKFVFYSCGHLVKTPLHKEYWQEVKQEINNL